MEQPLVKNMRENFTVFGGISLLYGLISVICLYQNLMGITAPLFVLATVAVAEVFMKMSGMKLEKYAGMYFAGMLFLGILCFFTSNFLLVLFAWTGILMVFTTAMMCQFYGEGFEFPDYICRFVVLAITTILSFAGPFCHLADYLEEKNAQKRKNILAALYGGGAALIFLAVVFPLLLQSDEIFGRFFTVLLKNLRLGNIAAVLTIFVIFSLSCYAFFLALCSRNLSGVRIKRNAGANAVSGITFTSVLAVVYVTYCSVQFTHLVLRLGEGLPDGMTYSQYAHSGFWQLIVVAGINVVTVLVCKAVFSDHKILKFTLSIVSFCTFLMMISAAYKMLLYVKEYQLTFLRFLVLCFLCLLSIIMCGIIVSIYKRKMKLFRFMAVTAFCWFLAFSFSRPDYQIAKYNIEHIENLTVGDVRYLMGLSLDAAPVIAQIDPRQIQNSNDSYEYEQLDTKELMENYFQDIELMTDHMSVRNFNLSKYNAKKTAQEYLNR